MGFMVLVADALVGVNVVAGQTPLPGKLVVLVRHHLVLQFVTCANGWPLRVLTSPARRGLP